MRDYSRFSDNVQNIILADVNSVDYAKQILKTASDEDLILAMKVIMSEGRSKDYEPIRKELIRQEQINRKREGRKKQQAEKSIKQAEWRARQRQLRNKETLQKKQERMRDLWDQWGPVTAELRHLLKKKGMA